MFYGLFPRGLQKTLKFKAGLDTPLSDCENIIANLKAGYPQLSHWQEATKKQVAARRYSETWLGRRRYLPGIVSEDWGKKSFAERCAMNTPIQGTAADIIKLAMGQIVAVLPEYPWIQPVLTVHDSLVFYVPEEKVEEAGRLIKCLMEKQPFAEFGFVEPVVWNERTGFVVGGHQRLKVLLDMGVTQIDCVVVDLEPEREKALNVALNRIQGDWDEGKLAEVLADIDASAFDVSFTGFDAEEMDALMNKFYSADAEEDSFDREAAAEKVEASGGVVTVPGDIWQLGEHRLLCGNGADAGAMGLLMGKERAACAVCAPPAVSMEEYRKNGMEPWISRMGEAVALLCRYADIVCWNVDDLFSTGSQYMKPVAFESMKLFSDCNFRPLWIRVWKKQGIMARAGSAHLSSAKPQRQFEYVAAFGGGADEEVNEQEYGWVSAFAAHSYRFVKRLTKEERRKWGYAGVWEIASMPAGSDGVPMVSVELPWRCMKMHSDPGGLVLDPFAGGGTVLIAAEQSGRRCFAMEGDPLRCDLIVMRWEQFTGEKAVRLGAADAGPEAVGE